MLHQSLDWRFQVAPRAAWIARTATGYFEVRLDTHEFGFCVDDQPGYPVLWFPARSIGDAKSRCEALARDADDNESATTVAVRPAGSHRQQLIARPAAR